MKKTLAILCLLFMSWTIPVAFAQEKKASLEKEVTDPCSEESRGNQILPCKSIESNRAELGQGGKLLPTSNAKFSILPQAIKMVLGVAGAVSVIVFVYAGVMLVVSQGNEEQLTKFKNVLIYSIIGLLLVTTSYGLVRGIMQLVFK